jgi:hypothetical protein
LQGNDTQGTVLPNQVQAVTAGTGVTISNTGALSINTADPSFNAFMRTNAVGAYNSYIWPGVAGTTGQQLTRGVGNALVWSDPDGIPWTTLGQLVVGTGVGTDTLLNVGADTSFLVADSSNTTTGLTYTDSLTTGVLLPVGNNTTERPATPVVGQIRYNDTDNEFEGYGGSPAIWGPLGGMPTGAGGDKIFYLNSQNVTTNYTLPSTPLPKNSVTAGPITINAGVTVTVPLGQAWSIV